MRPSYVLQAFSVEALNRSCHVLELREINFLNLDDNNTHCGQSLKNRGQPVCWNTRTHQQQLFLHNAWNNYLLSILFWLTLFLIQDIKLRSFHFSSEPELQVILLLALIETNLHDTIVLHTPSEASSETLLIGIPGSLRIEMSKNGINLCRGIKTSEEDSKNRLIPTARLLYLLVEYLSVLILLVLFQVDHPDTYDV